MSSLSYPASKPKFNHILVFDTIALLSADESNPEQVWRNNEQLGACCIPGGTYKELTKIANSKDKRNKKKANQFLRFLAKGGRYRVLAIEDNTNIPISKTADRQILACAYKLAVENQREVVVLVTYDIKKMGLVVQAQLPNFCMIEAREIAQWYRHGYYRNSLPKAIEAVYARLSRSSSSGGNIQSNVLPGGHQSKKLSQGRNSQVIDVEVYDNDTRSYQRKSGGKGNNYKKLSPSSSSGKRNSQKNKGNQSTESADNVSRSGNSTNKNLLSPALMLLAISVLVILGFIGFSVINREVPNSDIDPETGIIVPAQVTVSGSVPPTSSRLLALADNGILEFQQTKNSESLLKPINELQGLKNLQGGKLDSDGEEKLSKLKHKYAIEVLASRSQVKKAIELLKQIPFSYSDYSLVEAWLAKQ